MLKHTRKMLHFSAISLRSGRILKLYSQVLIRCRSYSSSQSYSGLVSKQSQSLSEDKYLTSLKLNFFTGLQSEVRKFSSEINLKNLSILSHPIHHSLLTFVKHWPFLLTSYSLVSQKEINRYHMMMHKLLSGSFWWETHFELRMTSRRPVLHTYWECQKTSTSFLALYLSFLTNWFLSHMLCTLENTGTFW